MVEDLRAAFLGGTPASDYLEFLTCWSGGITVEASV